MNKAIANFEGVPDAGLTPTGWQMRGIPSKPSGVLSNLYHIFKTSRNPSSTSPVKRGVDVVSSLLCLKLPSLNPADEAAIDAVKDALPPNLSPIKIMEFHRTNYNCASCHNTIDRHGIGLEQLNHFGKRRTNYADGTVIGAEIDPNFGATADLDAYLGSFATSGNLRLCYANQLAANLSRMDSGYTEKYPCYLRELYQGANSQLGLNDILMNFVSSDYFRKVKK